jgi:GT2 family glycosyltransferase
MSRIGFVVIGRNEGARLARCMASIVKEGGAVVYVDSASTDDSVAIAAAAGADVVRLAPGGGLNAARARNEGFRRLLQLSPDTDYVMFVDGDSALEPGWPQTAAAFLDAHRQVGAVSGDVHEERPGDSIYNRLCDVEWRAQPGDVPFCGGIAMMRASAVTMVGGFNETLAGGEEPELCVRLREKGWRIARLAEPMARHDAGIESFVQWFRRMRRGGRAFAEVSALHRGSTARIWRRETLRAVGWAALVPLALLGAIIHPAALLLLAAYPVQVVRIALRSRRELGAFAWTYAAFIVLAKFPEALGVLDYHLSHSRTSAGGAAFPAPKAAPADGGRGGEAT